MGSSSSNSRMSSPPSSPPRPHTPTLSSRSLVSPLFRGIAGEIDRDHAIDPIANGITASEWKDACDWKNKLAEAIDKEIDEAMVVESPENTAIATGDSVFANSR